MPHDAIADLQLPKLRNPATVAPPVGAYSHIAIVPPDATLLIFAGQVGNAPDGSVPPSLIGQYRNALLNIARLLKSEGAGPSHIVKLNTYLVRRIDLADLAQTRREILGDIRPPATLVYVPMLAGEIYSVEVEAWALRPMS